MKRTTLKAARLRAKLTQVQLAHAAGLEQAYISKLELGKIGDPSFSIVVRLAKPLGIDPQAFTFGKPAREAIAS